MVVLVSVVVPAFLNIDDFFNNSYDLFVIKNTLVSISANFKSCFIFEPKPNFVKQKLGIN